MLAENKSSWATNINTPAAISWVSDTTMLAMPIVIAAMIQITAEEYSTWSLECLSISIYI